MLSISSYANWAEKVLQRLSLDQKIGQLFIVASHCNPSNEMFKEVDDVIKKYHLGTILLLGNGKAEPEFEAIKHYQSQTEIPLLIAQDFEPGLKRITDNPFAMTAMALGSCEDDAIAYHVGKEIARQARMLGVSLLFAPVVDVNVNPKNPIINNRSFGADPKKVAAKGIAFMHGIQGQQVIACAKHFPGHGDTSEDSHIGLPVVSHDRARLDAIELYPFKRLINHGVKAVMTAHLHVPALDNTPLRPTSLSKRVITDLLQNELNFKGLIVTDALNMGGITKNMTQADAAVQALCAGSDMAIIADEMILKSSNKNDWKLYSEYVPQAFELVKQAVLSGKISEEFLNARVLKILQAKEFAHMHKKRNNQQFSMKNFYTSESERIKNNVFEQAVILLDDDKKIVPLCDKKFLLLQINGTTDEPLHKELSKFIKDSTGNSVHMDSTMLTMNGSGHPKRGYKPSRTGHSSCIHINDQQAKDIHTILKESLKHDVVVLALHGMNKFKQQVVSLHDLSKTEERNYGLSKDIQKLVNEIIAQHPKPVLVIFGIPYSRSLFNKTTTLIAHEEDEHAQRAVAKILMGIAPAKGILPI